MDPRNAGIEDLVCDESFQRYCRGEAAADMVFWEAWVRDNPDQLPAMNAAKRLIEVLNGGQGNRMVQKAALKDAISRRAQFESTLLDNQQAAAPVRVLKFRGRSLLKYAASIIVILSAGVLVYMQLGKRKAAAQLAVFEYHTGPQDRKTIILPDSSMVMLNGNSHLILNKDFDPHHRQVSITGEAFFDIKHDEDFPFLVNTSQYTIRVLGTTFNVRSYPGKDTTETTLLTGKIEILQGADDRKAPKVVLKPNEKFILNASAAAQQERMVQISKGIVVKPVMEMTTRHLMETSWTRGKMDFYDKPLSEIAVMLQHWYGIKIRFADEEVKNYRYTAPLNEETIFNVLRYLQKSYPFVYSIEDDCIVIARS